MTTQGRITTNFVFLALSQVFSLVSSVILIGVLARHFTLVEFGWYGYFSSIASLLLPLPFLGMTRVFERELSRSLQDKARSAQLFGATLLIRLLLGGVLLLALNSLVSLYPEWREFPTAIMACGAWAVLGALASAFTEFLVATERLEYEVEFNLLYKVALVAFAIPFVLLGGTFSDVMVAKALARGLQVLFMAVFTFRVFLVPSFRAPWSTYRMLVVEGLPLQGSELLQMVFFKIDEILLQRLRGEGEVGLFHGPYQVLLGISLLPIQMMRSAFPSFSRSYEQDQTQFLRAFHKGYLVVLSVAFPLMVTLFCGADEFTVLLLGPDFQIAGTALRVLSLTVPFLFVEVFFRFVLASMGRQVWDTYAMAVGVAVNVVADLMLIPIFGFLGACWGTVLAQLVVVGVAYAGIRREIGVSPGLLGWWQVSVGSLGMAVILSQTRGLAFWLALLPSLLVYLGVLYLYGVIQTNDIRTSAGHLLSALETLLRKRPVEALNEGISSSSSS